MRLRKTPAAIAALGAAAALAIVGCSSSGSSTTGSTSSSAAPAQLTVWRMGSSTPAKAGAGFAGGSDLAVWSASKYGLPQVAGQAPTQWVGGANFSAILSDPEFWLSLRISLIFAAVVVPLTLLTGTLVGLLLNRLGPEMSAFVSSTAMLAWATPAVSASVIFIWLADPDGGVVDWTLSKLPSWLGGGAHWAGFSWTSAALPAYTLLTVLVVWQGFPFVAVAVLAGLKIRFRTSYLIMLLIVQMLPQQAMVIALFTIPVMAFFLVVQRRMTNGLVAGAVKG